MDWLRISLLILGVILVAGIWVAHRVRERGRREARMREMDDWAEDVGVHIRAHRDDHEIEPTLGGITTELDQLLETEDRGVSRPPQKAGGQAEKRPSVPRGTAEPELKTKPGREAKREAAAESRPESRPAREPEPRAETKPAPPPEAETDSWQQVLRKPASVLSGLKERIGRLRDTEPARGARPATPAAGDGAAEQRQPPQTKAVAAERFEDVSEPRVVGRNPLARGPGKDKILVLHVVAPRNRPFTGVALGAALRRAGLKPGEMSIYHYHEEGAADREPLFSVANMVAPGTLTDENLSDMMTPGITMFLQVHLCDRPQRAFEALLETSHVLARDLGGRIMDAQQSTATNQTLAHMREDMNQWLLRHRPELLRRKVSR